RRVSLFFGLLGVDEVVDGLAKDVVCRPTDHPHGRGVHEGDAALGVQAVDPFADRAQNQLVSASELSELTSGPIGPIDYRALADLWWIRVHDVGKQGGKGMKQSIARRARRRSHAKTE